MIVRWEAGPHKMRPKTLKGELENNSRNPKDLVRNWHSDSLTLFQGKKKKADEVDGEDDDDALRTSVSQDRVRAKLCTEELFLSTSLLISDK